MQLITLTGLTSISKAKIAQEMAEFYSGRGPSVYVLDNTDQIQVTKTEGSVYIRLEGQALADRVMNLLDDLPQDAIVIFNVAESTPPDTLYSRLDAIQEGLDGVEVRMIAVIDDHTCDCFPNVRSMLEDYADVSIRPPFNWQEVLLSA